VIQCLIALPVQGCAQAEVLVLVPSALKQKKKFGDYAILTLLAAAASRFKGFSATWRSPTWLKITNVTSLSVVYLALYDFNAILAFVQRDTSAPSETCATCRDI
jgi:hypothetical protein